METLAIYPRESSRVGSPQSPPMFRSQRTKPGAPTRSSGLIPSTQLQRNAQFASASQGRFRPSPFLLPPKPPNGPTPAKEVRPHLDVTTRFGQRLRQLRVERNLTQTRMAEEFGIDRTFLSDVECGRKSITLPTLETLARGFRMTLSELLKEV